MKIKSSTGKDNSENRSGTPKYCRDLNPAHCQSGELSAARPPVRKKPAVPVYRCFSRHSAAPFLHLSTRLVFTDRLHLTMAIIRMSCRSPQPDSSILQKPPSRHKEKSIPISMRA